MAILAILKGYKWQILAVLAMALNIAIFSYQKAKISNLEQISKQKESEIYALRGQISNYDLALNETAQNFSEVIRLNDDLKTQRERIIKNAKFGVVSKEPVSENLANSVNFVYQRLRDKADK